MAKRRSTKKIEIPTLHGTIILVAFAVFSLYVISSFFHYCSNVNPQRVDAFDNVSKERRAPAFDDYRVQERFTGNVAALNYGENDFAKRFRGQISQAMDKGVNYGGHYISAIWGCGTNCQTGIMVDAKDGNVYNLPVNVVECGLDFRSDSTLLIANPDKECVASLGTDTRTRYFVVQ